MQSAVLCEVCLPHVSTSSELIRYPVPAIVLLQVRLPRKQRHTAGTVCLCPVLTEAIKAHQLGLREATEHGGFQLPAGFLFIYFTARQQNEISNHSLYRLGRFPLHPSDARSPLELVAAQRPFVNGGSSPG